MENIMAKTVVVFSSGLVCLLFVSMASLRFARKERRRTSLAWYAPLDPFGQARGRASDAPVGGEDTLFDMFPAAQ